MATPTWDQLIRPVLDLASKEPITRQSANAHVLKVVPMNHEEREERLKSGMSKVGNRVGWAMSHLTKAGLIQKVSKATYRATDFGKTFLQKHEGLQITYHDLRKIEGYEEAWKSASQQNQISKQVKDVTSLTRSDNTPEESIDQAVEEVESNLRSELLEQLKITDPYRFERVVLDLLFAMGYGGSREEAAQVTKKSSDEGIDGVINEDRLGLDVIYVQAKRWQNTVGRPEIQSFVGALAGKQAHKGVFITTSDFGKNAYEYAGAIPQKVILIDGQRLAELMIEHNVGVSTVRKIELKRIDSDYFDEG
jgi:restriction system protein